MIKHSVLIFLCLLSVYTVKAKNKIRQDTSALIAVPTNSLSDSLINEKLDDLIPTVTLEDVETSDEGGSDQGVAPVLNAGRDPFMSAASFSFSISRFRIRGYDNDYFDTYMNGIPTEYIDNGFGAYNLWAGLNDVTRNRDNSLGLKPSTLAFGSIGAVYSIDSRASRQRKQLSVTLGTSNRTYDLRGGITYGTGITKKGWSVAVSLFGRWAKNGYIKGTAMQSVSYFLSVQKFFKKQNLTLTALGAPTKQGKASGVVQEAYDLAGTNYYNPNWGYQNGKVRSAKVEYRHQPTFILTHEWTPKDNINLTTAAGYSFGERSLTRIDRYNARDPRPDYYKYLPSYSLYNGDTTQYLLGIEEIKANPDLLQINWNNLYEANTSSTPETVNNADGIAGNTITGQRAHYILGAEVQKYQRFNFNTVYNHSLKKGTDITAGLSFQYQKVRNFKKIVDLLGADYFVDVDDFIDSLSNPSAGYSDLNQPNHIVKEGGKYSYDYDAVVYKSDLWAQVNQHFKKIDFFVAANGTYTVQYRNGYFKNGLNPTNSEGKSKQFNYLNYAVKGGLTYKINGRHYVFANGSYLTRAPYWDNIFLSPRNTNRTFDPGSESVGTVEAGYIFNAPKIKLRATGFYTDFKNGSNTIFFYDDVENSFGNYTITNINKIHFGGELGVEGQVYKGLSVSFVAAIGKYYYSSRQNGTITFDNDPTNVIHEVVYSKNFYVANIPQQAYTLGLNYRSKKFWYVSANVNFFDRFYTEFAPTHRTERATDLVPYQSNQWYSIINQERYNKKGQWTVDLSGGYTWRLKSTFKKMNGENAGKYYLVINAGISNLTNNKKFIVSGREQLRYDYDKRDPNKFPAKYSYAYGINFYANLTFRF